MNAKILSQMLVANCGKSMNSVYEYAAGLTIGWLIGSIIIYAIN